MKELYAFRMDSGVWQISDDHYCILGWSWAATATEAIEEYRRMRYPAVQATPHSSAPPLIP